MALATTTTSSAVAASDVAINLASVSSLTVGMIIQIDQEFMQVSYTSSAVANPVAVRRGLNGSFVTAHVSGANATYGVSLDFADPAATTVVPYPLAGRRRVLTSYSASGAITIPTKGEDMIAVLNGTSVLTMTVAAPSKDNDGDIIYVVSNGVAAHTVQFTGGLSGAGGSYDICTINASAPVCLAVAMACNGLWMAMVSVPLAGVVTNVTATLS